MQENLNVDCFRNVDNIAEIKSAEEWVHYGKEGKPACYYYETNPANGKKYNRLYNWHPKNVPCGLAHKGWHVPSDAEWTTLATFLGEGAVVGEKMRSTTGGVRPVKQLTVADGRAFRAGFVLAAMVHSTTLVVVVPGGVLQGLFKFCLGSEPRPLLC